MPIPGGGGVTYMEVVPRHWLEHMKMNQVRAFAIICFRLLDMVTLNPINVYSKYGLSHLIIRGGKLPSKMFLLDSFDHGLDITLETSSKALRVEGGVTFFVIHILWIRVLPPSPPYPRRRIL